MKAWVGFVALVFAAGCGWQVDESRIVAPPTGAAEGTAAIVQSFELSSTPPVYWYAPDDCGSGTIHNPDGDCVWGFSIDGVIVLSTQNGRSIHETALGHELGHVASIEHDGTGDACHNGQYFKDPGDVRDGCKIPDDARGLVGAVNRELEGMGL